MKSHIHSFGGNTGGSNANVAIQAHNTGITADHEHTHAGIYPESNQNIPIVWYNPDGSQYGAFTRYTPNAGGDGVKGNWIGTGNTSSPTVRINDPSHSHDITQTAHNHTFSGTTASNDANAIENRPQNYTNRIWKRIA